MTDFIVLAVLLKVFALSERRASVRIVALTRLLCRLLVRVLSLRCRFENFSGIEEGAHASLLLLPNHISYLDVIVINAKIPSVFVTSREIEATPVLGWITRAAGCAFVERRNIWQVQQDIGQISALLNDGLNVTLFPEGSTSPGEGLMDFKKTLLESAIRSRCRVLPVCLKYEKVSGRRYDASNRDRVAWYGDMAFFPHLWRLMGTRSIDARLTLLSEVPFRGHRSRKRLARDVKARIAERFHAS